MHKLILLGAGGHAISCIDVIENSKKFDIGGIIDNDSKAQVSGYKILGDDSILEMIRKDFEYAFITVGQIETPKIRKSLFKKLLSLDFKLPIIKSKIAYMSDSSSVGAGTILMHGSILNSGSSLGKNCILNSKSLIEHDSVVSNFCHISTGALVNGGVKIGEGTFVGSGSVIKEGVNIGKNCIIGANTFVNRDLENNTKFIG